MIAYVQKWGNGQGIRIPKVFLEELGIKEKEKLEIKISPETQSLIISKPKERKTLEELFEGYEGEYEPIDIDWGEPVGREIW
jgi:antitoxin MazE